MLDCVCQQWLSHSQTQHHSHTVPPTGLNRFYVLSREVALKFSILLELEWSEYFSTNVSLIEWENIGRIIYVTSHLLSLTILIFLINKQFNKNLYSKVILRLYLTHLTNPTRVSRVWCLNDNFHFFIIRRCPS